MNEEYERGFIDGMQKQAQSSVDKAVNAMSQREWVGLTHEEIEEVWEQVESSDFRDCVHPFARAIEKYLKEQNGM
jgi:hypothetical protein